MKTSHSIKKKITSLLLAALLAIGGVLTLASCTQGEKDITVVARELGSGTREAFDTNVTDGTHKLEEKIDGKRVYYTTKTATEAKTTAIVLTNVQTNRYAIGYVSLGSVNDTVKTIKVGGVQANEENVLNGTYTIQRPFVIMTNKTTVQTELAADFLSYLKSEASKEHAKEAGCIWLSDPGKRANTGEPAINVTEYVKKSSLPDGEIVVRGSTSMEKFITKAAAGYAKIYGADPSQVFNIELEGSSPGRKAAENDTVGNVIGLSSASVTQENLNSFNVCLDAVAVIVNKENSDIQDLSLAQLYGIFSGEIKKFSALKKETD